MERLEYQKKFNFVKAVEKKSVDLNWMASKGVTKPQSRFHTFKDVLSKIQHEARMQKY